MSESHGGWKMWETEPALIATPSFSWTSLSSSSSSLSSSTKEALLSLKRNLPAFWRNFVVLELNYLSDLHERIRKRVGVPACVYVCVCVCVRERERVRSRCQLVDHWSGPAAGPPISPHPPGQRAESFSSDSSLFKFHFQKIEVVLFESELCRDEWMIQLPHGDS